MNVSLERTVWACQGGCQNQDLQDMRDFQDGLVGGWVVDIGRED